MTPVAIGAAVALVLAVGWIVLRANNRSAPGIESGDGDHILLDRSPVGALLLDRGLRITWLNQAFCDAFGLNRTWWVGREFSELVEQELKGVVEEPDVVATGLLAACKAGSTGSPFEFCLKARDGHGERWLQHTCQSIKQKPLDGSCIAYFVDITPRDGIAATKQEQEVRVEDFDEVLLKLARRNGGLKSDQSAALRAVADLAAGALKRDRCELWLLGRDRTLWTLDHLHYATPREREGATPEVSLPQTGPYIRNIDQVRVLVTSDVGSDRNADLLVGQGSVGPAAASRMDIPIRVLGNVVGALVIAHHEVRPWTSSEKRFAASIGDRLSLIAQAGSVNKAGNGEVEAPASLPSAASGDIDGFVHLDENLRFTFLNPAALQWLDQRGVDGNALVGRALEDVMKNRRDRSVVAEVRKSFRGGGPARLRRQLENDGPWLDLHINPSATGVSVTIQNRARVQERKAERSLLDSETRFRSVVESLREGLIITDLNDRIVYVNSRLTDLTGHRPEDLDGKQAQDLLFDTANWKKADSRLKARRERKRTRYQAPLRGKDGENLTVAVISTPLRDASGAVTGVVDAITALEKQEKPKPASVAS